MSQAFRALGERPRRDGKLPARPLLDAEQPRRPGDRQKIDAPRFSPGQFGGGFFQAKRGAETVVHCGTEAGGRGFRHGCRLRSGGQRNPLLFFLDIAYLMPPGAGFECRVDQEMAKSAMARASRLAPCSTSLHSVSSFGEWLIPPIEGTKISPAGQWREKVCAS